MGHHKVKGRDRVIALFMAVLLVVNIVPVLSYSPVKASSKNGEETTNNLTQNAGKETSLPEGYYIQVVDKEDESNPINIEGATFQYNIVTTSTDAISTDAGSDNNINKTVNEDNNTSEDKIYSYTGENVDGGYIVLKELSEWINNAADKKATIEYKVSLAGEDVPNYEVSEATIQFEAKTDGSKNVGDVPLTRKKPTSYVKFTVRDNGQPIKRAKISYEITQTVSKSASDSVVTYDDGTAYIEIKSEDSGKIIAYNISKNGYKTRTGRYTIANTVSEGEQSNSSDDGSMIDDFSKPKITVVYTDGTITYSNEGQSITVVNNTPFEVDAGSSLQFAFKPEEAQKGTKYIKELKVNGTTQSSNLVLDEGQYNQSWDNIRDDLKIEVIYGVHYTITVPNMDGNNGSVKISKQEINETNQGENSITIDSAETNKNIYVKVNANLSSGLNDVYYQIDDVMIGGKKVVEKGEVVTSPQISINSPVFNKDKTEYTAQFTVDDNVEVTATFIQVYKVEVTVKDSDVNSGEIKIDSEAGTSKVFRSDTNTGFTITATPSEGYKVSKVTENGIEILDLNQYMQSDKSFIKKIEKENFNGNYTYVVTFIKKGYSITVNHMQPNSGNVKIVKENSDISITECQHDDNLSVTVTPNKGKRVKSCTVVKTDNQTDSIVISEVKRLIDGSSCFGIQAVQCNITIKIEYEAIPTISADKLLTDYVDITALKEDNSSISNGYEIIKGTDEYFIYCNKDTQMLQIKPKTAGSTVYDKVTGIENNKNWSDKFEIIAPNGTEDTLSYSEIEIVKFDAMATEISLGKVNVIFDKTAPTVIQNENKIIFADRSKDGTVENYYNKDVKFAVKTSDNHGIKKVSYKVAKQEQNGKESLISSADLYTYKNDNNIKQIFESNNDNEKITVNANEDNIIVTVFVEDFAGNIFEESRTICINTQAPNIKIDSADDMSSDKKSDAQEGYYQQKNLKISIKDRLSSYNLDSVKIIANYKATKDEKEIQKEILLKDQKDISWSEIDTNGYRTAAITLEEEGIYEIVNIEYTNKNGSDGILEENLSDKYAKSFIIDRQTPVGEIKVAEKVWSNLLEVLTFSIWKSDIEIQIDGSDTLSDVKIFYFIDDEISKESPYTSIELDNKQFTEEYKTPIPKNNSQFVVYAKVIDNAGNYTYICSDGLIADNTPIDKGNIIFKPNGDMASEKHIKEDGTAADIYTSNVTVGLEVIDTEKSSGIQTISYRIVRDGIVKIDENGNELIENGTVTKESTFLYDFSKADAANPYNSETKTPEQLSKTSYQDIEESRKYDNLQAIVVNASENNSCDVYVEVTVTDKAGNKTIKALPLDIDYKSDDNTPSIDITLEEKDEFPIYHSPYFRGSRKATITVTDRQGHFNEDSLKAGIAITARDNKNHIPQINNLEWHKVYQNNQTKQESYQAVINFVEDDYYEMSVKYISKAGYTVSNESKFTIDNIAPTGQITVNTNIWNTLLETLTFGIYDSEKIEVTIDNVDVTSPCEVYYYILTGEETNNLLNQKTLEKTLDTQFEAKKFMKYNNPIVLKDNQEYVIYAKIMDYAGNSNGYISTRGLIIDDSQISPEDITLSLTETNKAAGTHEKTGREDTAIYNGDVEVLVNVADKGQSVGIKSIDYKIFKDDKLTKEENLRTFKEMPSYKELTDSRDYTGSFTVYAQQNNSCNVYAEVSVTDRLDRITTKRIYMDIDIDNPAISLSYDDTQTNNIPKYDCYFKKPRTATLNITERTGHFDEEAATKGIEIIAVDANDKTTDLPLINGWTPLENDSISDKTTHMIAITFENDANYKWKIQYENKAGLIGIYKEGTDLKASWEFTIDHIAPTGEIWAEKNKFNTWKELIKVLTFGGYQYYDETCEVFIKTSDKTSPCEPIYYYISTGDEASALLNKDELDKLYEDDADNVNKNFKEYDIQNPISVDENQQYVVYARLMDFAGNYDYISTNGLILDNAPINTEDIILSLADTNKATGTHVKAGRQDTAIYKGDVTVNVTVNDGSHSVGIQKIEYQIIKDDDTANPTQSDILYDFNKVNPTNPKDENNRDKTQEELDKTSYEELNASRRYENNNPILVKSDLNNSCNVYAEVIVTDKLNRVTSKRIYMDIDKTPPTISLSYDNDTAKHDRYFDRARTATVIITERAGHFDEDAAKKGIKITAEDKTGEHIKNENFNLPLINGWTPLENSSMPDKTTYTATIIFADDAIYKIEIEYKDKADWINESISTGDSKAPFEFAIDKIAPIGKITAAGRIWDKLLATLTFGLYHNEKFDITINDIVDEISPYEVDYYIATDEEASKLLDKAALDEQYKNNQFKKYDRTITITDNQQYIVYAKLTDYAGNYTYISTDGLIVDTNPISEADIKLSLADTNKASGTHKKAGREDTAIYYGDVTVNVVVNDDNRSVGIEKIEYQVIKDDDTANPTQSDVLYDFNKVNPTNPTDKNNRNKTKEELDKTSYEQLNASRRYENNNPILVKSDLNNSCNVYAEVIVTDKLDRVTKKKIYMDIDIVHPTIALSYDNDTAKHDKYFDRARIATIVITERTGHFDAQAATKGIVLTAVNAKGELVSLPQISNWTTTENAVPDSATHTASIDFNNDANYTLKITYTDKADRENQQPINTGKSKAPYEFTVDTTVPTAVLTAMIDNSEAGRWEKQFITDLTFGIRTNHTITVEGTSDDVTSPVESVSIYKSNLETAMTKEELKKLTSWVNINDKETYTAYTANSNEQFAIYIKVTDMAGNTEYYSTNGMIFDETAPDIEHVAPIVTIAQPINDIYNDDVPVDIRVTDPIINDSYSGLKQISYKVFNMDSETYNAILLEENIEEPEKNDICQLWSDTITVSKENNSNDVVVEVYALDYAGNETTVRSNPFKIDTTAPEISISYDNNIPVNEKYYKENRTAVITITERNFDANDVKIDITNTDGVIPSVSGWTQSGGSGNKDDTINTATITYDADGDYTFAIAYTDMAGNVCLGETYSDSATPKEFTIDKTLPVISMEIDGNSKTGSEYFDTARTATITVNEHNFNEADFRLHLTTRDNGIELSAPALSGFSSNGDIHTATIVFDRDEEVVISGDFTDMAGNNAETLQEARFIVDLTDPVIELDANSLIIDKTYGKNETVTPRINITDTNFDASRVLLEVNGRKYGKVEVNVQAGDIANGMTYVLSGIETDDVYEMSVNVTDHSGRENQYKANFHVNRNGSTYAFGSALQTINKTYVQSLTDDLTIIETNVDPLESYVLTLSQGGIIKELELNKDFMVSANVNSDGWMEYIYTIKNSVFTGNSTYLITIGSVDKAGNSSDSSSKDSNMTFVVDDEAPTLIVTGVENNKIYTQEKLDVTIETYDNIEIMELRVVLNGELRVYTAEELKNNNGKIIISIPSSDEKQSLQITAIDYAGNESQVANYTDITISTNAFIAFKAKYLSNIWFYIITGVVLIAVGAAVWFVISKRGKKENE